jgi:hypothetical protein
VTEKLGVAASQNDITDLIGLISSLMIIEDYKKESGQ